MGWGHYQGSVISGIGLEVEVKQAHGSLLKKRRENGWVEIIGRLVSYTNNNSNSEITCELLFIDNLH